MPSVSHVYDEEIPQGNEWSEFPENMIANMQQRAHLGVHLMMYYLLVKSCQLKYFAQRCLSLYFSVIYVFIRGHPLKLKTAH